MNNVLALMCVVFGGNGAIDETCIDRLNTCVNKVLAIKPDLSRQDVLDIFTNRGSKFRAEFCEVVLGYDYRDGLKVR